MKAEKLALVREKLSETLQTQHPTIYANTKEQLGHIPPYVFEDRKPEIVAGMVAHLFERAQHHEIPVTIEETKHYFANAPYHFKKIIERYLQEKKNKLLESKPTESKAEQPHEVAYDWNMAQKGLEDLTKAHERSKKEFQRLGRQTKNLNHSIHTPLHELTPNPGLKEALKKTAGEDTGLLDFSSINVEKLKETAKEGKFSPNDLKNLTNQIERKLRAFGLA